MTASIDHRARSGLAWPKRPFPLVRFLSVPATWVLLRLPVSANMVTGASLAAGLGGAWMIGLGGRWDMVWGALLILLCYVLDNSDGEVARARRQCSAFGAFFDSLTDWIVHAIFFVALGIGVWRVTGAAVWLWLGGIASAGGTINFIVGRYLERRDREAGAGSASAPEESDLPLNAGEWILFAFRELTRADFCFIVLVLALADLLWLLLPFGAVGAQLYWITQFHAKARRFHV